MTKASWSGTIAKLNTPSDGGVFLLLDSTIVPTRELPLPLTASSGDCTIQVGIVEQVERDGNDVTARGWIDTKLFGLFVDPPDDLDAVPVTVAVEPVGDAWHIIGAHLAESTWGDTTITITDHG